MLKPRGMTGALCALAGMMMLAGCQSAYRAADGQEPRGYREVQVSTDHFEVSYESWRGRERDRLEQWARYRAAELGSQLGYGYMLVGEVRHEVVADVARQPDSAMPVSSGSGEYAGSHIVWVPMADRVKAVHRVTLPVIYAEEPGPEHVRLQAVLGEGLPR
ncbi:CC0125/CC1285 family lipoprotein [Isoalcanivorax indicus]|uniref:CC0125/CC1285 family lipoprotein n=1 Tax=Isoalcanivorax indicus TaxID=2202653 RepID=UPI0013C40C54|nr:hypothetical protein [Isoalcanivorax indicus]